MTWPRTIAYSIVGLLMLLAVGCKKNTFTGYTMVNHDEASERTFYVNDGSVQREYSGQVSFSYVVEDGDGKYTLSEITTDCKHLATRESGTRYARGGTMLASVTGDSTPVSLNSVEEFKPAIAHACSVSRSVQSFRGAFDIGKAMLLAYGNYDPTSRTSSQPGVKAIAGTSFNENTPVVISVVIDTEFHERGIDKHAVLTSVLPTAGNYSCHACSPLTSEFVYSNKDGKWSIEAKQQNLNLGSGWGQPPNFKLIQVGPDRFGVVASTEGMGQGYVYKRDTILILDSIGPASTLEIAVEDSNSGPDCGYSASPCYSALASYEFHAGSNPELFDVRVINSGTKLIDQKVVSNDGIATYSYSKEHNKYQLKS